MDDIQIDMPRFAIRPKGGNRWQIVDLEAGGIALDDIAGKGQAQKICKEYNIDNMING